MVNLMSMRLKDTHSGNPTPIHSMEEEKKSKKWSEMPVIRKKAVKAKTPILAACSGSWRGGCPAP